MDWEDFADPEWYADADCRGLGDLFFVDRGESARPAKKICHGCRVRITCLNFALNNPQFTRFGIWGGTTEKERQTLRRQGLGAEVNR